MKNAFNGHNMAEGGNISTLEDRPVETFHIEMQEREKKRIKK